MGEEDGVLAAAVRQAPYFIGICDPKWQHLFLNAAERQMVGLAESADISTLSVPDVFCPGNRHFIREVELPMLKGAGSWEGEFRLHHFNSGADVLVNWRGFALRGHDGRFLDAATITTDVAVRREAELRLGESEARLNAAANLAGQFSYQCAPVTGGYRWGARVKAMWGLPADAPVDHEVWLKGIHRDGRERVAAAATLSLEPDGDGPYAIEHRVVGVSDGVERWVSARGRTFFKGRDKVQHIGAVQGITGRTRVEERLRRSEAYLPAIVEQFPIGVGVFDRDGRLTLGNAAFRAYEADLMPSNSAGQRERWRVLREDGSAAPPVDFPGARALRGETTMPGIDDQYIPPTVAPFGPT